MPTGIHPLHSANEKSDVLYQWSPAGLVVSKNVREKNRYNATTLGISGPGKKQTPENLAAGNEMRDRSMAFECKGTQSADLRTC